MIKKFILTVVGFMLSTSLAMAAPVNIPSGKEGNSVLADFYDGKLRLSTGVEYDNVFKRELDADNEEIKFNAVSAEIALEYDKNTKLYASFGQAMNIEFKLPGTVLGDMSADFENSFIWGVGLSGKSSALLEIADVFTDISYRRTAGMDYDSVNIAGTTYPKSSLGGNTDADWQEWHLALGVSKDFEHFLPYAGVRYSDVEASGKFSVSGTDVDLGTANSDKKVGLFVGTVLFPFKDLNINIQGRFIDEQAMTVSAAWMF